MNHIPQGAADQSAITAAEEKRQNEQRLAGCRGPHRFVREAARRDPAPDDRQRIVDHRTPVGGPRPHLLPTSMMRCQLCYGRVTEDQAEWYATGVMHGMNIEPPSRRRTPLVFDDGLDGKKGIV